VHQLVEFDLEADAKKMQEQALALQKIKGDQIEHISG